MKHRTTQRQQDILDALSSDMYGEVGTQPYSAPTVTYLLNLGRDKPISLSAVRATLKLLLAKGLVTMERQPEEVPTGLGYITRPLDCYWSAATEQQDRLSAKAWHDGSQARSDAALAVMVKAFTG